jgi:hypothetical protein
MSFASPSVYALNVPASVAAGTALAVLALTRPLLVQVVGTFVATIQLQGSVDGATWVSEGSPITAPGTLEISKRYAYIRANVTSYTSGAPVAVVAG